MVSLSPGMVESIMEPGLLLMAPSKTGSVAGGTAKFASSDEIPRLWAMFGSSLEKLMVTVYPSGTVIAHSPLMAPL